MRKQAGFLRDEDDSFDSTYAYFFFAMPEKLIKMMKFLGESEHRHHATIKFQRLIDEMKSGKESADTRRAREVGQRIMEKLRSADNSIFEI